MTARYRPFVLMFLLAALIVASALVSGQTGATNGEWPHWGADLGSTKYSPLDQINRDNVKNLRVAWRWKSDNFGPRPQNNMEGDAADGRRRALHAPPASGPTSSPSTRATGETLWTYRLDEGRARRPGAAQRVARRRVLDRRQAGSASSSSRAATARVARREDRPARSGVRQERRRRSLSGLRSAAARRTASSAPRRRPSS